MNHRTKHWWLARLGLAAALLTGWGTTLAQPLADYVPAGSIVAFGFWQDSEAGGNLHREIMNLDWEGALETVTQTALATGVDEDLNMFMDLFGVPGTPESLDFCPAAADLWAGDAYSGDGSNALISIGFSPFNPMPAVTAVAELTPQQNELTAALIPALLDCAADYEDAELLELDQDGVPFWQLTIDFDASFAFSHQDGILTVSSSADQLRYSLRLQAGSDEPSLADNRLHEAWAGSERGDSGFSWLIDYGVVADLIVTFGAGMGEDELVQEIANLFRTVGGTVGSLSQGTEGLVYESQLLPDETGGVTELIDLLLAEGLELPDPPIVPAGAISVSSGIVNVHGFHEYLQLWLDRIGPLVGEQLNLRELLAAEGINLDTLLLDWVGTDLHHVQLEASTASVSSLVRSPAQFLAVQTTDPAAALTGVSELADLIIGFSHSGPSVGADLGIDRRQAEYRGHDYMRLRVGPVTDLGIAILDDYLVIGMPVDGLHSAIDQFLDGGPETALPARPAGSDTVSTYWLDTSRGLEAAADLFDVFVQPLAWVIRTAALEEAARPDPDVYWEGSVQDWSDDFTYGNRPVSTEELQPLALGSEQTGVLTAASGENYWLLEEVPSGTGFHVRMESSEVDSMLELYELETGRQVAFNDDYDWLDGVHAQIDYTAREGVTYVALATRWGSTSTGEYTVSLWTDESEAAETEQEEAAVEVSVPEFSAFLDLAELGPAVIRIVAGHTGELEGFQERRGDTLYTRYLLRNTW